MSRWRRAVAIGGGAMALLLGYGASERWAGKWQAEIATLKAKTVADSASLDSAKVKVAEAVAHAEHLEATVAAQRRTHLVARSASDTARAHLGAVLDSARTVLADTAVAIEGLRRSLSALVIAAADRDSMFSKERAAADRRIASLEVLVAAKDSALTLSLLAQGKADTVIQDQGRQIKALERVARPPLWQKVAKLLPWIAGAYLLGHFGV